MNLSVYKIKQQSNTPARITPVLTHTCTLDITSQHLTACSTDTRASRARQRSKQVIRIWLAANLSGRLEIITDNIVMQASGLHSKISQFPASHTHNESTCSREAPTGLQEKFKRSQSEAFATLPPAEIEPTLRSRQFKRFKEVRYKSNKTNKTTFGKYLCRTLL